MHNHTGYKKYLEILSLQIKNLEKMEKLSEELQKKKSNLNEVLKKLKESTGKTGNRQNMIEETLFNHYKAGYILIKKIFHPNNKYVRDSVKRIHNIIKYSNSCIKFSLKRKIYSKILEVKQRLDNLFEIIENITHLDLTKKLSNIEVKTIKDKQNKFLEMNSQLMLFLKNQENKEVRRPQEYLDGLILRATEQFNFKFSEEEPKHCQEYSIRIAITPPLFSEPYSKFEKNYLKINLLHQLIWKHTEFLYPPYQLNDKKFLNQIIVPSTLSFKKMQTRKDRKLIMQAKRKQRKQIKAINNHYLK